MANIILHHYENSPFAEKVRVILGYKRLAWLSVVVPRIMPKPDLIALTGGYRRTPVMQIGADIYCDTALIADVLERMAPADSLYPTRMAGLSRTLAQWADNNLFWSAIAYCFQPAGIPAIFPGLTADEIKAFAADRTAMRANAPRMAPGEATGSLAIYLRRLDDMLSGRSAYLLGDRPTIADFAAYHPVWFIRRTTPLAGILNDTPRLLAWAERMQAIGHHEREELAPGRAIEIARESKPVDTSSPKFVDMHGIALGEKVAIMPTDYALDPVVGELMVASENELAVRRTDERAGTVVVHFPRIGFQMKKQ
jgi:glutathione S-transferase